MHIYEGEDFSTKQEHLQQIYTKGEKKDNVYNLVYITTAECQERPLAQ